MKVMLTVLLILLLLVVSLPIGMDHMGDCPACTATKAHFILAFCAGIVSLFGLTVLLSGSRLRLAAEARRRFLLSRSIYRPPRFA